MLAAPSIYDETHELFRESFAAFLAQERLSIGVFGYAVAKALVA